jgi:hypothetical protein
MDLGHAQSEIQARACVVSTDLTAWLWCAWCGRPAPT